MILTLGVSLPEHLKTKTRHFSCASEAAKWPEHLISVQGKIFFMHFRVRTLLEHSPYFFLKPFEEVGVLVHCDVAFHRCKDFMEGAGLHHGCHGP